MISILNFSFFTVVSLGYALWMETNKRKTYGKRPSYLLKSLIVIGILGLLSLVLQLNMYTIELRVSFFNFLAIPFYAVAFFLLEYSIHQQRIHESGLMNEFKQTVKINYIFYILLLLTGLLGIILIIYSLLNSNPVEVFLIDMILLTIFIAYCVYQVFSVFSFQQGVLRKKNYTVYALLILTLGVRSSGLLISVFSRTFENSIFSHSISNFFIFLPFIGINMVFLYRAFEEYFFHSTQHLNNIVLQQEESEQHKTEIINKIIVSTKLEDQVIIESLVVSTLEKIKEAHFFPQHNISGLAIYRKKGDRFYIEDNRFVFGFTPPLFELQSLKMQNRQQLIKYLTDTVYSSRKLLETPSESLSQFGDKLVKEMLETKQKVVLESIPQSHRGIIKLISLYPIINNQEFSGFIVVYKDQFHRTLIHEDNMLKTLGNYLNTVFSIINGKELQEEKNRLEGEITIARDIQTSIIPKKLEVPGYKSAGIMQTASEVGGDVYDLRSEGSKTYGFIGDVSGHGLPAGIMALIQQSAFHGVIETAKQYNISVLSHELYDLTNRVLCLINRDRIGSDKFMTGNSLVIENDRISHAGTHEIALHYKSSTGDVIEILDCVEKTAFLGLSEFINSAQSAGDILVETGDVVLFYTDGVIEAKNERSEQYGVQRLKTILRDSAQKNLNSEEIIDQIMKELSEFAANGDLKKWNGSFADDVSMVVFIKD